MTNAKLISHLSRRVVTLCFSLKFAFLVGGGNQLAWTERHICAQGADVVPEGEGGTACLVDVV